MSRLLDRLADRLGLTRRQAAVLGAIVLVALLGRLAMLVLRYPQAMSHDELGYDVMARQLITRGVFGIYSTEPNAFVTPGYPLVVAAVFKAVFALGGGHALALAALRTLQALLGAATVALTFSVGRKAVGVRVGLVAAAVMALYPSAYMAQGRVLTEAVFTFLFVAWLLAALVLRDRRTLAWHLAVGALFAAATLVRPAVLPMLPLVYALDLVERRDWRFAFVGGIVALLAFAAVMSPWWVRNRVTLGRTVLFATQTGNPLLRGADPWDPYDKVGPSVIEGVPEARMADVAKARIRRGFAEDTANWLAWFTVGKWWWLWGKPWMETWLPSRLIHYVAILGLGWLGVIGGLFDRRVRLLALVVLVTTAAQLAFIPIPRYMYPLTPVMAILGAWAALSLYARFLGRDTTSVEASR